MRSKIAGVAVLIMLSFTILSRGWKKEVNSDTNFSYTNVKVSDFIEKDTKAEYIFTPEEDFDGIKLLVATYGRAVERGELLVAVFDEEGRQLAETGIEAKKLWDNQFAYADTGHLHVKGTKLRVVITGRDFPEREGVVLWMGENSLDADSATIINGIEDADQIIASTYCKVESTPYTWELLLWTAVCFLVFVMQWESGSERKKA